MNKKQCILSSILSVILVAVVLLSLTDCAFVTHHPSWSPWSTDGFLTAQKITTYYTDYSPSWVGVFTAIQLILLWVLRKPFACWFGIVLNIVGTVFPWFRMVMEAPIEKWSELQKQEKFCAQRILTSCRSYIIFFLDTCPL